MGEAVTSADAGGDREGEAVLNQGRVNNAVRALSEWHRDAVGREPDFNDRLVFTAHSRAVLAADDRYLAGQTAPKVGDPDRLRLLLAKARLRIEELKLKAREANASRESANWRERQASEAIEKAKALEAQAFGWRRSADAYCAQANILRQQLIDAGIEPDPRAN